jgi:hypothetical protein
MSPDPERPAGPEGPPRRPRDPLLSELKRTNRLLAIQNGIQGLFVLVFAIAAGLYLYAIYAAPPPPPDEAGAPPPGAQAPAELPPPAPEASGPQAQP